MTARQLRIRRAKSKRSIGYKALVAQMLANEATSKQRSSINATITRRASAEHPGEEEYVLVFSQDTDDDASRYAG